MRSKWILIPVVFFLGMFLIVVAGNLLKSGTSLNTKDKNAATSKDIVQPVVTSTSVIFFQRATPGPGIPSKTTSDKDYPGVAVFWIEQGKAKGQDTCTLYDASTNQIYASRYRTNGRYDDSGIGTAYYENKVINKNDAVKMLNNLCFKP